MKRNYKHILMILILAGTFCVNLFADDDSAKSDVQKITVSKVRVFLDNEELGTEENAVEQNGKIKRGTILSYTRIKPEEEYSTKELEKEMEQTRLRLLYSGLFYTATLEKMDSRKNPGTVIIYINVTTGFLKRYGGGGIYAVLGDAALNGNREQLLWFVGYNKNGVSYSYERAFGTPLILGADLFVDAPYCFVKGNGLKVDGKATIGSFITPDFRVCVDAKGTFDCKQMQLTQDFVVSPYLSMTDFYSEKLYSTTEVRVFYYPLRDFEQMFDTAYTINYSPVKKLTIAGLLAGGYCPNNVSKGLSLYRNASDVYKNLGLANRAVRSGYSEDELNVRGYLMGTLEIRWKALSFTVPPCFPCSIIPYVFTDVAAVEKLSDEKGCVSIVDAYGIGAQLNFECPVFAYFNFSYGFNHEGKGKFTISAVQSF